MFVDDAFRVGSLVGPWRWRWLGDEDDYHRMIVLRHNGTKVTMLTSKGIEEYDFSGRTRLGLSDHLYVTYKCQRKCIRCISFVVNSALYDDYEV